MARMIRNLLAAFITGFIAGVAPFLSMQLVPALLNPELSTVSSNSTAIWLTGLLVGAITCIVFGKTFDTEKPREVFAYALGIPAILIATVSNLSTKYSAASQVSSTQEALTAAVLSPMAPETVSQPTELTPPGGGAGTAWVNPDGGRSVWGGTVVLPQQGRFLVVIGQFAVTDTAAAWAEYRRLKDTALRTERYAAKNLAVFRLESSLILVYARYSSAEEANKVYRLLRINDPDLPARVVKY